MEKIRQETNCRVREGMAKSLAGMSQEGPFRGRHRHLEGKTRSQPLKLEGGKGLWGRPTYQESTSKEKRLLAGRTR